MAKHAAVSEPMHIRVRRYAKGVVAIAGAIGGSAATLTLGDGPVSLQDWFSVGIYFLTAIGVIGVPNKDKKNEL